VTWPSGRRYEGEWKDDKLNGQGVYTYTDGTRYEGEFKDSKYNGQGVMTYPDLLRIAMRWTKGNRHDADDLIQEAALKLLEKRDRYNDDNFTGLFVRIMKNVFLDEIRKNKGKEFVEIQEKLMADVYENHNTDISDVKAALNKMDENCRSIRPFLNSPS